MPVQDIPKLEAIGVTADLIDFDADGNLIVKKKELRQKIEKHIKAAKKPQPDKDASAARIKAVLTFGIQ